MLAPAKNLFGHSFSKARREQLNLMLWSRLKVLPLRSCFIAKWPHSCPWWHVWNYLSDSYSFGYCMFSISLRWSLRCSFNLSYNQTFMGFWNFRNFWELFLDLLISIDLLSKSCSSKMTRWRYNSCSFMAIRNVVLVQETTDDQQAFGMCQYTTNIVLENARS